MWQSLLELNWVKQVVSVQQQLFFSFSLFIFSTASARRSQADRVSDFEPWGDLDGHYIFYIRIVGRC